MAFSKLKAHLPKVGERRIPRLRRRELKLLASGRHGVNEALLVHGHHISKRLIAGLVRSGLAAAEPEIMKAGGLTTR